MCDERGLSLIEVLFAVALLVLAFAPFLSLFVASRKSVEETTRRTEALALARAAMDDMAARADWADIRTEGPNPHPLDSNYIVTVTVTARASYLKDILVQVEWSTVNGAHPVELFSTVYKRE